MDLKYFPKIGVYPRNPAFPFLLFQNIRQSFFEIGILEGVSGHGEFSWFHSLAG
jgi:hypothetical protein